MGLSKHCPTSQIEKHLNANMLTNKDITKMEVMAVFKIFIFSRNIINPHLSLYNFKNNILIQ